DREVDVRERLVVRDEDAPEAVLRAVARPPFAPAARFAATVPARPPRAPAVRTDIVPRPVALRAVVPRAVVLRAVVVRPVDLRAVVVRPGDLRAVVPRAVVLRAEPARAVVLRLELVEREEDDERDEPPAFDDDFVSPDCARCLLTVRAAISFARPVERPDFCSDSLTCSY